MKEIKAIELTAANFKDYGYIIHNTGAKADADNEEFTYWGKVSQLKMGGVTSTGILCCHQRELIIKKMERHVNTPEVLVAVEGDSLICLSRPSNKDDEIKDIKAFYLKQGSAVALNAGAWHWVPFPINCEMSKFIVVFTQGTEDNDLEIKDLDEKIRIV